MHATCVSIDLNFFRHIYKHDWHRFKNEPSKSATLGFNAKYMPINVLQFSTFLNVIKMSFQGARSCSSCIVKLIVMIIFMFGIKHLLLLHHKNRGHKSHRVSKVQRITKTSMDQSSITLNSIPDKTWAKYIQVWF